MRGSRVFGRTLALVLGVTGAAGAAWAGADADSDNDGLSDFHEVHKHRTDPAKADSDGDGVPDGDWLERREFTYTVRAVMHILPPINLAEMTDDFQDTRLLDLDGQRAEVEVIIYPLSTAQESIAGARGWRTAARPGLEEYLRPGITCNFDDAMREDLAARLAA